MKEKNKPQEARRMKNKPWSTHRELKKQEIPNQGQLIVIAKNIKNLQERALFIMAYLTGGRISEVVREKYLRKVYYKKEVHVDEAGNKTVKIARNANKSPIIESVERLEHHYPGIRRENIFWTYKEGRRILIISMQNRKNRRVKRKRIPVPLDKEKELIGLLMGHLDQLQPDQPLFPFSKSKAEEIIKRTTGMNPHFLRDIRCTRLVIDHNFTEYQLMQYMGWTDGRPAARYVRLNENAILGRDY